MRDWHPLIEWIVRHQRPSAIGWIVDSGDQDRDRDLLEQMRGEFGARLLTVSRPDELDGVDRLDLVLVAPEPNWAATTGCLNRIADWSHRHGDLGFPIVLVANVGWPYGRRDRYRDASLVPPGRVHPHRRGGLLPERAEPVPSAGFEPQLFHAIREHPFRNGCLTAVEDFLRASQLGLRLQVLPGFQGLAVLATTSRLEQSPILNRLFDDPGGLLLEVGHVTSLEQARLTAITSERVETSRSDGAIGREDGPAPGPTEEAEEDVSRSLPAEHTLESGPAQDERIQHLQMQLEEARADIRRLAAALLEIRALTLDLLQSNRWRLGNRLGDLYLKIRGRTKTASAEDRLRQLFKAMGGWGLAEKVTGQFAPATTARRDQIEVASAAAQRELSTSGGLFYRLVSTLDAEGSESEYRQQLTRSESRLASFRTDSSSPPCRVSIVMPTWNRAFVLGDAITSVLEQTYPSWQLIVADDGSTDDTERLVGAFDDRRIEYVRLPHSGAAAARNRALDKARGELIAYLDSDNVWHPQFLEIMVGALARRSAASAAYARLLDVEIRDNRTILRSHDPRLFDYPALHENNFIDLNVLVHRRELFDVFGGFDESLPRHQDWDLVLRYGFVTELIPVDAMLALYRRNTSWNQITSTSRGDQSWHAVRARVAQYYTAGVSSRKKPCPVTLVAHGDDPDSVRRCLSLKQALTDDRAVSLIEIDGAASPSASTPAADHVVKADDGRALLKAVTACASDRHPGIVYACHPSEAVESLLRKVASRALPVLIELRTPSADRAHPHDGDSCWRVLETLSPAVTPAGYLAVPPVSGATHGPPMPVPRRDQNEPSDRTLPLLAVFSDLQPGPLLERLARFGDSSLRILDASELSTDPFPWRSALESASALLLRCRKGNGLLSSAARIALLTAFAGRVPVIATRSDELVSLEDTGCLAATVDSDDAILDVVSRVLSDRDQSNRMTERAWQHHRRCYSPTALRSAVDLLVARVT